MIDFKDKNVLVTGGNGMIGRQLVELLYDTTSANVTVADLPNVDLRDRKDCKAVCEGQDIVFHLAGIKGSPQTAKNNPSRYFVPMLQFNTNMMEAAREEGVEWYLYTSSVGVYEQSEVLVEDDVLNDGQIRKATPHGGDGEPLDTRNMAPLLTARFDQGATWNTMCPVDQAGPNGYALVGCVAVSMGQVMHYWGYPEYGSGDHGYNSPYGYLYADFGSTTYDYAAMETNTGNYHSQILSYHCGIAVNMNYGPDGSGAWVMGGGQSARNAMRNYFGFQNNIVQAYPENYSTSAYRQLLQDDLI